MLKSVSIQLEPALKLVILLVTCSIAVLVRVFSIIRYESIIHEFDPWFNYRATKFLVTHSFSDFWNFFDSESWYPLGRDVGGTVYPGIMSISGLVHILLHRLGLPVDIREICVFLSPAFAGLTSYAAYLLTREVSRREGAGLLAALLMGLVPSYMSRSVSGGYDNEGVAIFALVFTFYLFIRACNTGSMFWALTCSLSYFLMVASWGGYSFIVNIVPIFVFSMLVTGHLDTRMYVAYSLFYVFGTILAMQVQFVRFQAIHSSEHMASHGIFLLLQLHFGIGYVRGKVREDTFKHYARLLLLGVGAGFGVFFILLLFMGQTQWSGRSMTLLDPTYAKKYIPIVFSVAEHQATTWSNYFLDLHYLNFLAPVGLYVIFTKARPALLFIGIYTVLAVYFSSVMVRLMLVLCPAVCVCSAIGVSWMLSSVMKAARGGSIRRMEALEAGFLLLLISYLLHVFICHGTMTGAEYYSSPSVVLSSGRGDSRVIIDDYREGYYWMRMNTRQDSVIMSWWDYGYQITGFSNRTTLVDNNTWNNTHIATVGLGMASPEDEAFEVCERLDVDYVLVIFGGASSYSGDDINKFIWMIRISGGVYPHIKEEDYVGSRGYKID
jgi:dolichyl-diphosphooligosaccharide--protein glycosyltransferase